MADSIREQILQELTDRLKTVAAVNQRVFRSRAQAAARAEMPALIVTPLKDPAQRVVSICGVDRFLTVRIAVIVQGDVPDATADPIIQDLHKKLVPVDVNGFADVTLGGLAIDISQVEDNFEFAFSEGVILCDYLIQYRHSETDLAQ